MQGNRFNFGGARRSYWDFYFGYALIAAVICLVEAAVFWQLAGAGTADPGLVRSLVAIFIALNVVHALLASRYFFITPIVADVLVTACLVVACLNAGT